MSPLHSAGCGHFRSLVILFCLVILAAVQPARAQNSYPPSGDALINGLTIGTGPNGTYSTALGNGALSSNNSGGENTAVGYTALYKNSSGSGNAAFGIYSLKFNTSGGNNTAIGRYALFSNTTGSWNTACGALALSSFLTTGSNNTAIGTAAMESTSGSNNTGLGYYALIGNTSGYSNVAVGTSALFTSSTASNLVAVGDSALYTNTGSGNTAIGSKTLFSTSSGEQNTALGFQGLYSNTTGYGNTATGYQAAWYNTGNYNSVGGIYSLYFNTSGSDNTAYGVEALVNNSTGADNTAVGGFAGTGPGNLNNTTAIGYGASTGASNSVVIGNSSVTSIGGQVNWTAFSDGRYKKNITQNVPGLAFINKLTPITYTLDVEGIETMRHKNARSPKSPNGTTAPGYADDPVIKQAMTEQSAVVYTGFVAQDVDKAAQSIGYKFSGVDKPKDDQQSFYGLRYSEFVVPLVKAVQELSAQNDSLQQANAQLSQRLEQIEQVLGIKTAAGQNSSSLSLSSARLFQNVPNPFNQTTLINYYLPQTTGTALLQITGMNGETIKSIALNGTGAGQVTVQTAQLAAGTYTYSLIVDGRLIDTKKMVMVK